MYSFKRLMFFDVKNKVAKMKAAFILSYDLGIDGDYEGLYFWLDEKKARECGDSVAFIKDYEYKGDLIEHLKKEISKSVTIRKKDRIYVFHPKKEGGFKGSFLFGKRKKSPWAGYATDLEDIVEDE